jgi:hypothetical protein
MCLTLHGTFVTPFARCNQSKIFVDTDHGSWDSAGENMPVQPGRGTMDSEKELLDAFDRVLHEDFPNPQLIACPKREVLLKLVQQPADSTQLAHLLAHIRQCAPCFDGLKELKAGRVRDPLAPDSDP